MSGISGISSSMMSSVYAQSMKRPDPAEMFKKVDTDGNGGISQNELNAMAEEMTARSGQTLDLSEAINTYDLDGDALLSQDEMGTMMMALKETMGPPPPPGSGTSPEQATAAYQANSGEEDSEDIFNSLDTNGDGVISQDELEAMFDKMAAVTGSSPDSAEAISSYDQDGDEALNQEEMDTMMTEMRDKMGPPPPPLEGGTSPEQAAAAYQANSDSSDTLAVLLDLMDRYTENITTSSATDPRLEV
jgi:Ca2+-binding EF-hand superfamily protein